MRRGMRWTWGVALSLGLGLAAIAQADEDDVKPPAKTGNWLTRLFAKDSAAKKKETDAKREDKPSAPSVALIRQKAQSEWLRRQEVCDKLRQIALETGDQDLSRKADALDHRAWDLYVQQTGGAKGNHVPDEQSLEGQPDTDATPRFRGAGAAGASASANLDNRAAARKD